jgi:hypothetical protein
VRKRLLALPVCAGLALVALLVWFTADDARQAAILDARVRQAEARVNETEDLIWEAVRRDAPRDEQEVELMKADVYRARMVAVEAQREYQALVQEQRRRQQSWPARLRREIRRRLGACLPEPVQPPPLPISFQPVSKRFERPKRSKAKGGVRGCRNELPPVFRRSRVSGVRFVSAPLGNEGRAAAAPSPSWSARLVERRPGGPRRLRFSLFSTSRRV